MNPFRKKAVMPDPADVLLGRGTPLRVTERHAVNGNRIVPPFPEGTKLALFGLGCFWGAERKFWQMPGVYSTAVGYAAGSTPNPTYEEVCSGYTGHNEVVVIYIGRTKRPLRKAAEGVLQPSIRREVSASRRTVYKASQVPAMGLRRCRARSS